MKQKINLKENTLINKNNSNIYKKIDNYDFNKNNNIHINQLFNGKIKNKNIFFNNKYSHDIRLINSGSVNGYNNNSNLLKESTFNKFKTNIGLNQNRKQLKTLFKKGQKSFSAVDIMSANNKRSNIELNKPQNLQNSNSQNIPLSSKPIIYNQKINIRNFNFNEDTQSGSTFAYSKKYNSHIKNNENLTEEYNNKFRMGLLSASSNSNNNIIIPMLPLQRPLSNFNLGGGQIWENIDNININKVNQNNINSEKIDDKNNKHININKKLMSNIKIIDKNKINNEIRNKIGTAPSQKRNENNYFSNNYNKEKNALKRNYNNFYGNVSSYGQKFHHIKIDKSIMNNKLLDSVSKNIMLKFMNMEQKQLPKIKSNLYNEIKKIRNNSTKC